VPSNVTLDKINAAAREAMAFQADFLGAIRLPAYAFKQEGTSVVTDVLFLRKREKDRPASHADPAWLSSGTLEVDGARVAVNRYFLAHPGQVLGTFTRKDRLYAGPEHYTVQGTGALEA